ncbi:hypothetical protein HYU22_03525 [Candidatus Woesearchaeota archaeon]|nr:hypothetical protein [Candidatus Woesearchaeota archaeon]
MATLQKIAALAVLALFILSIVPLAWAEEDRSGPNSGSDEERDVQESADDADNEAPSDDGAISDDNVPAERENREGRRDARRELEALREQGHKLKEKVAKAREEFEKVKDQYKEKKHEFELKKKELKELNEKAKCKDDSDDCKAKKVDLKRGVKQHLIKTAELIERSLEKLTNRVESSKVLDDAQKQQALDSIAALEVQLTAKQAEIEAMADDAPAAELKAQIKELKKLWQDIRKEQKRIIADLISHKQESITKVYIKFGERVEGQINKLAEQGADVSKVQELLAQYRAKVDELKAVPAGEREQFKQVMHDAKEILRELLKEVKDLKHGLKPEAEDEQENESADQEDADEQAPADGNVSPTPDAPADESPEVPAEAPVEEPSGEQNPAQEPAAGEEVPAGQ